MTKGQMYAAQSDTDAEHMRLFLRCRERSCNRTLEKLRFIFGSPHTLTLSHTHTHRDPSLKVLGPFPGGFTIRNGSTVINQALGFKTGFYRLDISSSVASSLFVASSLLILRVMWLM